MLTIVAQDALSPTTHRRFDERSRRGTVTTIDRTISPPSSVKAFAEARRWEREGNDYNAKDFADTRSLPSLKMTASHVSGQSRRTRRYTNESGRNSTASSNKSAEDDVCFPVHNPSFKDGLDIDFEALEEFIADEELRAQTTHTSQPRVFHDLRCQKTSSGLVMTSDGDFISSGSIDEKCGVADEVSLPAGNREDSNRFDYFSSLAESTIHGNELGDLLMPGENIRSLFTFPVDEQEDGVWWLNLNNPSEDEIRVICKAFGIHPLTREDIFTQEAREKIELFPNYYFASFRSFTVQHVDGGKEYIPFNIYVIVFREGTLSFSFSRNTHGQHVRQRITSLKDFVAVSSDWICYALM